MELLADRDPEEARKLLDPVLERMMEAVHRYEGTVNQVMGDGIMALFGAPVAHEDHAVRACYAALQMQESVTRYAETLRRTEAVGAHIRVGLNSGEVVVRSVAAISAWTTRPWARRRTWPPAWSRWRRPDRPSSRPARCAWPRVTWRCARWVPCRSGLPEPVDVYELTGAAAARTRFQVAATRGLSRFVGREAEIEPASASAPAGRTGSGPDRGAHRRGRSREVAPGLRADPVASRSTAGWSSSLARSPTVGPVPGSP